MTPRKNKKRNKRGRARRHFLEALIERDGNACHWCGGEMTDPSKDGMTCRTTDRSIDHLVPVLAPNANSMETLVLAHRICNEKRGAPHGGGQVCAIPAQTARGGKLTGGRWAHLATVNPEAAEQKRCEEYAEHRAMVRDIWQSITCQRLSR